MFNAVVWGGYKLGNAHWEQATKAELVGYLGHRMIALIEYVPLLGTLVAKIDEWFCSTFYPAQKPQPRREVEKKEQASLSEAISSLEELEKLTVWVDYYRSEKTFKQLDNELLKAKKLDKGQTFKGVIKENVTLLELLGLTPASLSTALDEVGDKLADRKNFEGSITVGGATYNYHTQKDAKYVKGSLLGIEDHIRDDDSITLYSIIDRIRGQGSTIVSSISGQYVSKGRFKLKNLTKELSVDIEAIDYDDFRYSGFMNPKKVLKILSVLTGLDDEALQAVIDAKRGKLK